MSTTPTLNPELVTAFKRLKFGQILETLPERLVLADKQDMTFDDLLLLILIDEIARRDGAAADNRARSGNLDPTMRLELWDKTAKVSLNKRMLAWRRRSDISPAVTAIKCASSAPTRCYASCVRVGLTTRVTPKYLLILDDFALEPMSKEESKDVYQLFLERTLPRPEISAIDFAPDTTHPPLGRFDPPLWPHDPANRVAA